MRGAQSVILEHWGLMGSQPPLFFPTPVSGGLVLWVLNAAGISCKALQKGICDIIIIYVTLCILKHSVRLIFSCHPQNTPVRTEQLTFFFLRFTFGSFFFFSSFHFSTDIPTCLCITPTFCFKLQKSLLLTSIIQRMFQSCKKVTRRIHS